MKREDLAKLLNNLAACAAKAPTAEQRAVLVESIVDNALTDEEIRRGYIAIRDSESPWWPSPGQFLAAARPKAGAATVAGEADTIFQRLIDAPASYGTYNPNVGVIYSRAKVEAQHGKAAGEAFAAVASRFRALEAESVPFVRREFVAAYEAARADHGAPTTTDPSRMLPSPQRATGAISGAVEDGISEQRARFEAMLRGGGPSKVVDFNERLEQLRRQAQEIA